MLTGVTLAGFLVFTSATPPTLVGRAYKLGTMLRVGAGSFSCVPDVALDPADCIPLATTNSATGAMVMTGAFLSATGVLLTINANTVSATGVADGPIFQTIVFKVDNNR